MNNSVEQAIDVLLKTCIKLAIISYINTMGLIVIVIYLVVT